MYTFPFVPYRYSKTASIGAIILLLCLIPSAQLNKLGVQITFGDVVVHFFMFLAFSIALFLDIIKKRKAPYNVFIISIITILISISLGITTEFLQYFITPLNRTGSMLDLGFDFFGSVFGAGIIAFIKRKSFLVT
jgi:hypothetical protein